jgi:hypothetical protein
MDEVIAKFDIRASAIPSCGHASLIVMTTQ